MLLNIFIKNFGIIDLLKMDFQPGFNVLTGETGAGKSIIIDALQIALGGRASAEQIRSGEEKAVIQAAFHAAEHGPVAALLEEQGVAAPEDGILILAREIARSGRNMCRINGQVVPLAFYRNIGRRLADLHVQHEQSSLLDQEKHRRLLDRFGGPAVLEALAEVGELYSRWREACLRYEKLCNAAGERAGRLDLLRYQIEEIERANLRPGEDEELSAEKMVLANGEKISHLAARAYSLLYEGSSGQASALDLLAGAADALRNLAALDQRCEKILAALEGALYQVEDAARELAAYRDGVEYSPERLEAVEDRLEQIRRLKKKYGATITGVLQHLEEARGELAALENVEELSEAAGREVQELEAAYRRAAGLLSAARREAARLLEEAVAGQLLSLEMGRVEFRVAFTSLEEPSREGTERVDFLISPNPGEPLKPLAKIASGGELTRIMLALKVLLAEADEIPVLVFDEADTGIGGRALQALAEKLARLGERHQVICVTHSAQVASYARVHHRIVKEFEGGRTVTRVEALDPQGRLEELARMLGGRDVTGIARRHAGQLLRLASAPEK
ncbi:MAG: DNA repair protein RecN [Peptococcaceae bacterium]|nr:DNA repair protein RecN [Peptococcaceae bacterium]